MLVPTITVLLAARKRLSNPKRWCTHSAAKSKEGCSVSSTSNHAVCWCALGAINRAACDAGLFAAMEFTTADLYRGQSALLNSLDMLSRRLFPNPTNPGEPGYRLQDINDRLGREAVLQVLDAAIAELRAQKAA